MAFFSYSRRLTLFYSMYGLEGLKEGGSGGGGG